MTGVIWLSSIEGHIQVYFNKTGTAVGPCTGEVLKENTYWYLIQEKEVNLLHFLKTRTVKIQATYAYIPSATLNRFQSTLYPH